MDEQYNNHYVTADDRGRIVDGWSDGPFPGKDVSDAVCIHEQGGYQFRLEPDGEENPALFDRHGVPRYKLADGQVIERTKDEIIADIEAIPAPAPTAQEKLEAQVTYTAMMTDTLIEG